MIIRWNRVFVAALAVALIWLVIVHRADLIAAWDAMWAMGSRRRRGDATTGLLTLIVLLVGLLGLVRVLMRP